MKHDIKEPVTTPGTSYSVKTGIPVPAEAKLHVAVATISDYTHLRHLLSNKPLRRPNRNRPIE
jgi:uncharacterized protein (UPF0262 family)